MHIFSCCVVQILLGSVFLNVYFSQTTELEDECVRISKGGLDL